MTDEHVVLSNERKLFMLNKSAKHREEIGKYIFSDEVTDYTFFPYKEKAKNAPKQLENVKLYLYMEENDKLIQIPCSYDALQKKIYITDTYFNKYWKEICRRIYKATHASVNTVNELMNTTINATVDLSLLETSSRKAFINKAFQIEYKGKEIDIEKQRLISKRASAMENSKIKFIYSTNDSYVHDKVCKLADKIDYQNFGASEELPENRRLCHHCIKNIYIRNAIQNDNKNFALYLRFFEKGQVGFRLLEQFLWHEKAKLYMPEANVMQIFYNEDTWLVKMNEEGICTLEHNNYAIIGDSEREILSGFHSQKTSHIYLSGMIRYIRDYDWKEHLELRLAREAKKKLAESLSMKIEPMRKEGLLRRIMDWFHKLLPF